MALCSIHSATALAAAAASSVVITILLVSRLRRNCPLCLGTHPFTGSLLVGNEEDNREQLYATRPLYSFTARLLWPLTRHFCASFFPCLFLHSHFSPLSLFPPSPPFPYPQSPLPVGPLPHNRLTRLHGRSGPCVYSFYAPEAG